MAPRPRATPALMIQGTGSNVGKSLTVAGLCRAYTRRGLTVRPFKPQNMSNNAAVTADGGEIGRAQALQARACGTAPVVDMNPVLLKPQGETGAQVVVHGRVAGTATARAYQAMKPGLLGAVLDSFRRLADGAELVLVEGAGSAAEINLRDADIANMGFARAAGVPVIVVGDIDRGGVIASLVGTHAVLAPEDRATVRGYIVNRFRGDPTLFAAGIEAIGERTGWPCFGVVPFLPDAARLPAEDSAALERTAPSGGAMRVAVPLLPRIANADDLDPLRLEPGVAVELVPEGRPLPVDASLVVLPGSKATIADLAALRRAGWDIDLRAHLRRGGRVLGLCGGYQMLGRRIADPEGIEGPPGAVEGLGLLDVETVLRPAKRLAEVSGRAVAGGAAYRGYEMHMGMTDGPDCARPLLRHDDGRADGAVSADGRVAGCYVHGLFADSAQRAVWLGGTAGLDYDASVEAALDAVAAHLERHLDLDALLACARETPP